MLVEELKLTAICHGVHMSFVTSNIVGAEAIQTQKGCNVTVF